MVKENKATANSSYLDASVNKMYEDWNVLGKKLITVGHRSCENQNVNASKQQRENNLLFWSMIRHYDVSQVLLYKLIFMEIIWIPILNILFCRASTRGKRWSIRNKPVSDCFFLYNEVLPNTDLHNHLRYKYMDKVNSKRTPQIHGSFYSIYFARYLMVKTTLFRKPFV